MFQFQYDSAVPIPATQYMKQIKILYDTDISKDDENNQFTMFPCCMYPSNVCMSSERVLEVELYCECRMPELSESYFGFPTGDMIECPYCKEGYHDCCRKIPKNISQMKR